MLKKGLDFIEMKKQKEPFIYIFSLLINWKQFTKKD